MRSKLEIIKAQLTHYWRLLNRSIPPLGISLLLHLMLIVAVVAAGITTFEKKPVARTAPVIQAHAVDGAQLRARAEEKRKKAESEKRRVEKKRKEKAKQEKAKRDKAKKEKAKKQKAQKEKAKRDKAKKEKAKKKKAAAKKKRDQEKKRKQKEKKERDRKAAKKKAEKRKADARRKQREQQMLLDAELEMEQLLRAGRSSGGDMERSRLQSKIRQQIEQVWRKPRGTPVGRSCKVKVRLLMPDGGVGRITFVSKSGNPAFDLSVERAIYEAAPFPLPKSVELRREIGELEMIFVHEG